MSVEKNGWLIQSSLLFLRQCRVISGTAKAVWCIAFMPNLAPSSPLQQNSKLLWPIEGEGVDCWAGGDVSFPNSSDTMEDLFQGCNSQHWADYLHHKEAAVTAVGSQVSGVLCKDWVIPGCVTEHITNFHHTNGTPQKSVISNNTPVQY